MDDRKEKLASDILAVTEALVHDLTVVSKGEMEARDWRDGAEAVRALVEARGMLLLELKDG